MGSGERASEQLPAWELGLFAPSVSKLTPVETATLASRAGYRWIEWRVQLVEAIENSPWGKALNTLALDHLKSDATTVASVLNDVGIKTCGLQVDAPTDDAGIALITLEAAQILGCPLVRVQAPAFDPRQGYRAQCDAFRTNLSAWVKRAKNSGVRICVETHFDTIAPSASLAVGLVQEFAPSQVGLMWDPANGLLEGAEAPALAVDQLGPYLAEVHVKNGAWRREEDRGWAFDWCDLGEGMANWPRILALLHQVRYAGPLVLEDYRPTDAESKLVRARDYLEKVISSLGES